MRFLIIKTSAIGDIVQSLDVLEYLHMKFPNAMIDWVAAEPGYSIVASHPLINKAILFENKKHFKSFFSLRRTMKKNSYDFVIDLQGNCKSGLITMLSCGKVKIGFNSNAVAEWPNLIATHFQYPVNLREPIGLQYLKLIQSYFGDQILSWNFPRRLLKIDALQRKQNALILNDIRIKNRFKILVSANSRWKNKKLNINTLKEFLIKIDQKLALSYVFVTGNKKEKEEAHFLSLPFEKNSIVLDRLAIPTLQNLIDGMDLVIGMDSFVLHLAATANTPTFSVFGPTSSSVYKPVGENHYALQGECPYNKVFAKRCDLLRSCSMPYCMEMFSSDQIYKCFILFFEKNFECEFANFE